MAPDPGAATAARSAEKQPRAGAEGEQAHVDAERDALGAVLEEQRADGGEKVK